MARPALASHRSPRGSLRAAALALSVVALARGGAGAAGPLAPQWTERSPAQAPSARWGAALAFDPVNGRVLLFGGHFGNSQAGNDTWLWIDAGWVQKPTAHSPPPREGGALALDPVTGKLLLFGGEVPGLFSPSFLSDTWLWDGNDWSEVTPLHVPSARSYASLAIDPVNGRLLLHAGSLCVPIVHGCIPSPRGDTWTWNGTDWSELAPEHVPPARGGAAMAVDETANQLVLFGGSGYDGGPYTEPLGDTWTWNGSDWTAQSPEHAPSPRSFSTAAFDPGLGSIVLFGGSAESGELSDTWQWTGSDWSDSNPIVRPSPRRQAALAADPSTQSLLLFGGYSSTNLPFGSVGDTWTEIASPLDFEPLATVRVGADVTLTGTGITPGTVLKVFLSTASGPIDLYPAGIQPTATTPSSWQGTLAFPWPVGGANATSLGNGVVTLALVATDRGFFTSPPHGALLYGDSTLGVPTITALGGMAISSTSTELGVGAANVESVVIPGASLVVTGEGFASSRVNVFTASGNVGPLVPTSSSGTSLTVKIPAAAPVGPGSVQVVNTKTKRSSGAVSVPIGEVIAVLSVSLNGSTVTVNGTGFNARTVSNLFTQDGFANLGGLHPDGSARIPLTIVSSHQLRFTLPAEVAAGRAYVQALNPPFIPFTSSGTGPGGAFVVP